MDKLHTLKLNQLKKFCITTGTASSGTKSTIVDALQDNLQRLPFENKISHSRKNFNIVSVDMGIKNFAFVRLQLDKTLPFNRPPTVTEWVKFDINHWNEKSLRDKSETYTSLSPPTSFEPDYFSNLTYRLVDEILFNPKHDTPDFILIERQRARSMGSSNILEWVFKVNMFESMLYAFTYAKIKSLGLDIGIISSSPKKMGEYWKPLIEEGGQKAKDNKDHRLKLVEHWLKGTMNSSLIEVPFLFSPKSFDLDLLKVPKLTRSKTKWINQVILSQNSFLDGIYYDTESVEDKQLKVKEKGDDLVDCLLHGLSFVEWERNKMFLNLELKHEGLEKALEFNDKLYSRHFKSFDFLKQ